MPPPYTQTTFKPVNPFTEEQPVRPNFRCNTSSCPNTTSLSVCAGCKVVAYCSKSCQKADWGLHKWYCKQKKSTEDSIQGDSDRLQIKLHQRLFLDFREVHTILLHTILEYIVDQAGGAGKVDFSKQFIRIICQFNNQGDFNPATAYRIATLHFVKFADLTNQSYIEPVQKKLKADNAAFEATCPTYQGSVLVMASLGDLDITQPFPICFPGTGLSPEGYEEALGMINDGLAIRDVGGTKYFGRIAMENNKWRWKKLAGAAGNLSSHRNIELALSFRHGRA